MSEELKNTLIEVRKAYRLIYLYQYYVFDIVRKIVEEFGNPKFYCWDTQHYEKPPPLTSSPLDRWTWDMLPTYDLSLLFLSVGADTNRQRQGDWLLEIRVVADDGFELQGSTEPDPTKFRSP